MQLHPNRIRAWVWVLLCGAAAFVGSSNTRGQEGYVQPAGTWVQPGPPVPMSPVAGAPGAGAAGPTWQDFNELANRLQATEARLQAMSTYTSASAVVEEAQNPYAPNASALAAETQTPENFPAILSRLSTLENNYTADKAKLPLVRMTGFAQLDYGAFGQDAASRANLGDIQDGTGFRRARLQAVGNLSEFTKYSFEMDFAVAGRPSFMDVWGEQSNVPFFGNLRIGHFRQPLTMDGWTSIRHLEFLERSLPFQAMDPFRRVGIMSWFNAGADDRTLIAASVYASGFTLAGPTFGEIGDTRFATQIGDNGGVSAAIRGTHLLYWDPYAGDRYLLHVGGGYNYSQIGGSGTTGTFAKAYEARAIPEFFVGDPGGAGLTANGTPFVADTGRFLANDFHFFHTELAGNYGPAHFQTEYMATLVDQMSGPQIFYHGAYVQCGYFLTGENCGYNKQMGALDYNVKPFREFFGLGRDQWFCGWGAWEVAARYSYVNLSATPNAIVPVPVATVPPYPNPGTVNDVTLALNWWWNQYTRVQFNYINVNQNLNAPTGGITNIYAARFQFEF